MANTSRRLASCGAHGKYRALCANMAPMRDEFSRQVTPLMKIGYLLPPAYSLVDASSYYHLLICGHFSEKMFCVFQRYLESNRSKCVLLKVAE